MPFGPPPANYRGKPALHRMEPGTVLWRVQPRPFDVLAFNSQPANRLWGGGRFDCTADDWYPYLYAALSQETALAELLLRDRTFPGNGHKRTLPAALLAGKQLYALEVTGDLQLISLMSTPDLAAIRQEDGWLVEAEGRDYAFTRDWAHWLRQVAPRTQGIIWNSRRNLSQPAVALFGDRCPPGALRLAAPPSQALDDEDGAKFLNDRLAPYHARVGPLRGGYRSNDC